VQAQALLRLANSKLSHSVAVAEFKKDPSRWDKIENTYERLYGEKFAKAQRQADEELLRKEAEQMYVRLVKEYADDSDPETGTLAKQGSLKLNALRAPLAACQQAPELEVQDIASNKLKLRDFRGKVVLLVFTGDWCAACQALYPQQRSLLKDLAGKPFAMVDVNCDERLERRKQIDAKENVTWPSLQERLSDSPTAARWGIDLWPTLFLIDQKGIIRLKYEGLPGEKTLKTELDKLIKEAESQLFVR
jgi:peroxiredoxin